MKVSPLAVFTGVGAILVLSFIRFPTDEYVINTYGSGEHMEEIVSFDTVRITRYVHIAGVEVTHSLVEKAEIECIDVTIEPATIIQSCRNTP